MLRLSVFFIFQNLRLKKIYTQIKCINDMCNMMSVNIKKALYDVHPSYAELERSKSISISNSTIEKLAGTVHALNHEKKQRLRKVCVFAKDIYFYEIDIKIAYTFQ
jgi:Ase1/PRC1/MAP65 family protein